MYFRKWMMLLIVITFLSPGLAQCAELTVYQREVGGIYLNIVELPYGSQGKVGLAHRGVGFTEDLASIALREGAAVAINGTFFEAYGGRPEPNNNLITKGRVIHVGDVGTTIGFFNNGSIRIEPVKIEIEGSTNGSYAWPNNWYAWGLNHTPDTTGAYIFTPERGPSIGFARGISVVVSGGTVVKKVVNEDVQIPYDGYVINFVGEEAYQAKMFAVGTKVEYRCRVQATGNWFGLVEGLGAGPRLVSDGSISVNPSAEGFSEAKINEWAAARSAIGTRRDGTIILATSPGATVRQMAAAMMELGATEAMNLDGGASSCLWVNGKYLVDPGRNISNGLLFFLPK